MNAGELPAVIPVEMFLAASPKVTIDLSAIYVYSDHCEFDVTWTLRRTTPRPEVFDHLEMDPVFDQLRCIAELADGRVLSDFGIGVAGSALETHGTTRPTMEPLPPPGELRITLDWPEFGIHNAVTVLDATAINQAARRVQLL